MKSFTDNVLIRLDEIDVQNRDRYYWIEVENIHHQEQTRIHYKRRFDDILKT